MKISLPFFVFEAVSTINAVLRVIFRSNPENSTWLWDTFIPRKIETIRLRPSPEKWAVRIKMWSNGVYIDAISEGYADSPWDQYKTVSLKFRAKRHRGGGFPRTGQDWCEFEVPVQDILQAEKNLVDGIADYRPEQVEARKRQTAALRSIHDQLRFR